MSRGREKLRRDLLYDDPVDCGICTLSKDRKAPDESRTVSEVHRGPSQIATYGLFAGHGGTTASELCARNFVPTLLDDHALKYEPERALRNTCQALEAFVLAKSALDRAYYGTTLLFVLIKDQRMYIANIGNSRAVLATRDGIQTVTQEHDGSHAEEVARVRNAGGFFQDGKVNNLIRVTRSIGDLELKDRKHVTFPNRKMTEDIVIATPDIFCRKLSSRDDFLVMATAEVWETLSNNTIVQIVAEALRRGENSRNCAKKVATAALVGGARGPLTVMLLIFAHSNVGHDKVATPPRRRTSRPSTLKRHSSNAEQELWSMNNKAKAKAVATPAFVLQAQAQAQNRRTLEQVIPHSSPVTSPHGSRPRASGSRGSAYVTSPPSDEFKSTPFLSLDVSPAVAGTPNTGLRRSDTGRGALVTSRPNHVQKQPRAQSMLGIERIPNRDLQGLEEEEMPSRRQINRDRARPGMNPPSEQLAYNGRELVASAQKATVVSRMSELTASGATGGAESLEASYVDLSPVGEFGDVVDYNPSGPSKVRYREDGTIHSSRLGFLREFGRTFVRRR